MMTLLMFQPKMGSLSRLVLTPRKKKKSTAIRYSGDKLPIDVDVQGLTLRIDALLAGYKPLTAYSSFCKMTKQGSPQASGHSMDFLLFKTKSQYVKNIQDLSQISALKLHKELCVKATAGV